MVLVGRLHHGCLAPVQWHREEMFSGNDATWDEGTVAFTVSDMVMALAATTGTGGA